MRRRFAKSVAAMTYAKVVTAIVQLAIIPVFAVHWGLALYGQWLMIATVPLFLSASDFGFSTAASNRIIGEVARDEAGEAAITFQTAFKMILQLTAAVGLLGALVSFALPDRLLSATGGMTGGQARIVLLVMLAFGLVALQEFLFAGVMRAQGRQAQSVALTATTQFAEGLATLSVVALGGRPIAAATCYLVVRTVGVCTQAALAHRYTPWLKMCFGQVSAERLRELFRPAIAAMAIPLSYAGYLQGTAVAIGLAAGPAAVPLYTSLRTASRVGMQLTNTVVVPIMPEYTAAHAQGNAQRLARMGGILVAASACAGIAMGAGLILFGGALLDRWTHGVIRPPQAMIALMGIGLVLGIVWNAVAALLLAINRHETYSYAFLAAATLGLAPTYLLVLRFGVTGAAMENLAIDAIMLVVVMVSLRRNVGRLEFSRSALVLLLPARWRSRLARR
jgi:O-antigen/teichoic acid export membrane protein